MRLALAIAVIAVTWSAALYVHQSLTLTEHVSCNWPVKCIAQVHPSWADPAAVLLALGGVAVAVGIAYRPKPNPGPVSLDA